MGNGGEPALRKTAGTALVKIGGGHIGGAFGGRAANHRAEPDRETGDEHRIGPYHPGRGPRPVRRDGGMRQSAPFPGNDGGPTMTVRSSLPALAFLCAFAALAAPPNAPSPVTASGTFEDKDWKLELAGAYAFRDKSNGLEDEERIQVAVSNSGFVSEALDEFYDRHHAINTLFADEETKVVYFEFDDAGKYHGVSYYFESGVGCGWCFSSKVQSTVRPVGGRLQGTLAYRGDDRTFDVRIDVPIPPKTWGDPLPKDGGAPGKAFLAYAAALEKRDTKAIRALLDDAMKARFDEYEKKDELEGWLDYRWKDEHTEMRTIRITGGFVRGDRAVVLFDGSNSYIDHLYGEALLRREGGAWLVHKDMVGVGTR